MLSQETIDIVKSTVPLLEEHGETITKNFYQRMFSAHPYLKNIFNQTNQATGDQPRSLRDSVIAYAQNIDNLEALAPAVARIAHKHTSLNIQPKHYPIVGENLLLAISDVLDLPQDHPAIKAWGEAYQALANILIDAEEAVYQQAAWRGFKEFYIAKIEDVTQDVKAFYLLPLDKGELPSYQAGQFIAVQVQPDATGYHQIRQYSITQINQDGIRICVKRDNDGSVSNYLHSAALGSAVNLLPPFGVFTLNHNDKKKIFISGGIGITPLVSMLGEAIATGVPASDILFIQSAQSAAAEVFKQELSELSAQHGFSYKRSFDKGNEGDHEGLLDKSTLEDWFAQAGCSPDNAEVYFCGPKAFMHAMNDYCQQIGFDSADIHFEVFGPTVAI